LRPQKLKELEGGDLLRDQQGVTVTLRSVTTTQQQDSEVKKELRFSGRLVTSKGASK